jgi:hypothetical protein
MLCKVDTVATINPVTSKMGNLENQCLVCGVGKVRFCGLARPANLCAKKGFCSFAGY